MRKADKVIITCAVTGSIHTPGMSPYLPVTPDEITKASVEAAEAGAAVLHLHARNPTDGRPTHEPEVFRAFLSRIKQRTSAVLNITSGHGPGMTVEQRIAVHQWAKPELASLNMGPLPGGPFKPKREPAWRFDWEKQYMESMRTGIAQNSVAIIETIARDVGQRFGTRFEFECYDIGHLYTLRWLADEGLVQPPFFIQCIFGIFGGIGPDPENLTYMVNTADKLFGDDWMLSVLATGRHQMRLVTQGALLGGSVRVGLEDSLFLAKGRMAASNAEQVAKIRRILEELSYEIATPDEARVALALKGADQVAF
jgi:uncharacterized protein (DUF849 family)